ncbi:hypothetical protein EMIHUDRAFT_215744 [Emiliania huxleyi CCMP1516]|uniref:VWFA domain-containing protein n=2 Tax=Emiliania huxleyi TaxID=2903 RepID=A0A0D3IGV9_EMIH1|nr:hypothetical protein EMIHUDRAFT_215744 [Emiliania huxleyi CCMP1516]EOD10494.1 hypothetical protein EMIHUDRAFT_215744 [Emiliania huxleyi CCMP1516]|eukprot:XP_005762923.1 hypothetical protein EMIHUDRAFT_215744 [Emiliania huxleyi CCMP1516]
MAIRAMAIRSLLLAIAALVARVAGQDVKCDVPLELVLLIDTSGSASDTYCLTEKMFYDSASLCTSGCTAGSGGEKCGPGGAAIRNFVQILKGLFEISESAVRVSVIQFPSPSTAQQSPYPPIERVPLTGNAATLSAAIDQISDPQGGTNIGAALTMARTDAFISARQDVPQAVMLIADGEQSAGLSPSPKDAADALKREGVQVASVPAGAFEAQELDAVQTYLQDNFCRLYKRQIEGGILEELSSLTTPPTRLANGTNAVFRSITAGSVLVQIDATGCDSAFVAFEGSLARDVGYDGVYVAFDRGFYDTIENGIKHNPKKMYDPVGSQPAAYGGFYNTIENGIKHNPKKMYDPVGSQPEAKACGGLSSQTGGGAWCNERKLKENERKLQEIDPAVLRRKVCSLAGTVSAIAGPGSPLYSKGFRGGPQRRHHP